MNFSGEWFSKIKEKSGGVTISNLDYRYTNPDKIFHQGVTIIFQTSSTNECESHILQGSSKRSHYLLYNPHLFIHLEWVGPQQLEGTYICANDTGIIQLITEEKCQACLEGQANQSAHMEMGGCCYK